DARPSFPAAAFLLRLAQVRGPDDRAGHAHLPEQFRDLRAMGRCLDMQVLQSRALRALRPEQHAMVEDIADQPPYGRADGTAQSRSHGGQNYRRHPSFSSTARHWPMTGQGDSPGISTTCRNPAWAWTKPPGTWIIRCRWSGPGRTSARSPGAPLSTFRSPA